MTRRPISRPSRGLAVSLLFGVLAVALVGGGDPAGAAGPPRCSGPPATIPANCPGPTVTGFFPTNGPSTGGTPVTLLGDDFGKRCGGVQDIVFDGVAATSFTVQSDSVVVVTAPPHAPGLASVVVRTHCGASYPFLFTYT